MDEVSDFVSLFNNNYSIDECYDLAMVLADSGDKLKLKDVIGDCFDNSIKLSEKKKRSINPSLEELNLERYEKD